jgi:hypothetical protein
MQGDANSNPDCLPKLMQLGHCLLPQHADTTIADGVAALHNL